MLDEKILDRARRLIKTQFEERRKIFPNETSQMMEEMNVKNALHSGATLKKIHDICVQEVAIRTKIVWDSILRAHNAVGSPLTETLANDIKEEVHHFIENITKEVGEKMASEMRFMERDARHYNLDDARNSEIQKINIEADLYVDSLPHTLVTQDSILPVIDSGKDHKKNVFISHAAEDKLVAEKVKAQIENVFGESFSVFVSSITIEPGEDWLETILDNIKMSDAFIVIITPLSERRPFVWFEIGFSWVYKLSGKTEIYPLCVPPIDPGNLLEPLRRLQAISLAEKEKIRAFFERLSTQFNMGDLNALDTSAIVNSIPEYPEDITDQKEIQLMSRVIRNEIINYLRPSGLGAKLLITELSKSFPKHNVINELHNMRKDGVVIWDSESLEDNSRVSLAKTTS